MVSKIHKTERGWEKCSAEKGHCPYEEVKNGHDTIKDNETVEQAIERKNVQDYGSGKQIKTVKKKKEFKEFESTDSQPWPEDETTDFRDNKNWKRWRNQVSRLSVKDAKKVLENADTDSATLEGLSHHKSEAVRFGVVNHKNTHENTLGHIIDNEEIVRIQRKAFAHPNAPLDKLSPEVLKENNLDVNTVYANKADKISLDEYNDVIDNIESKKKNELANQLIHASYINYSNYLTNQPNQKVEDRSVQKILDAFPYQFAKNRNIDSQKYRQKITAIEPGIASYSQYADQKVLKETIDRAQEQQRGLAGKDISEEEVEAYKQEFGQDITNNRELKAKATQYFNDRTDWANHQKRLILDSPNTSAEVVNYAYFNQTNQTLADDNEIFAKHPKASKAVLVDIANDENNAQNWQKGPSESATIARKRLEREHGYTVDKWPNEVAEENHYKERKQYLKNVVEKGEGDDIDVMKYGKKEHQLNIAKKLSHNDTIPDYVLEHKDSDVRYEAAKNTQSQEALSFLVKDSNARVKNEALKKFDEKKYQKIVHDKNEQEKLKRAEEQEKLNRWYYGTTDGKPRKHNQYFGD